MTLLAIDDSTDNTDISQLCIFDWQRFLSGAAGIAATESHYHCSHYLWKTGGLFKKHGLSLDKVNLIMTDGALAMAKTGLW